MKQLNWYFNRLKIIPLREYPYRVNREIKKIIDRCLRNPQGKKFKGPYDLNTGEHVVIDLQNTFPAFKDELISYADNVLAHKFDILGVSKDYGDAINWHLDPKTGRSWPLEYWGKIDYRDGNTIGGIKFAWELNRLHHFPRLAIAYSLTDKKEYKDEIFRQLLSWMKANPYPLGINWIMGIELGIRIVNLVYTLKFLGDDALS